MVSFGPWRSRAGVGHNGDAIARLGLTDVNHNLQASEASRGYVMSTDGI